jgi:hypothetical protein
MKSWDHHKMAEKLLERANEPSTTDRENLLLEALVHAVMSIEWISIANTDDFLHDGD